MTHPEATPQQKRLDAIRNRVALASPEWGFAADGDGFVLTAGGKDGNATVAKILAAAPFADSELILNAVSDLTWLLDAYTKLSQHFRQLRGNAPARQQESRSSRQQDAGKDFAANCAILCAEPAFKVFLKECHGLEKPLTDDRAANKVRFLLKIRSRAELNTDPAAASRWQGLRNHFDAWRRRG